MIKIIDGLRYNTETADRVCNWDNSKPANDLFYYEETLYRTKKGVYFIHGDGNAGSPYNKSNGSNAYIGSEDIKPLSDSEAKQWLENNGFTDELETYFAGEIEDA